MSLFSSFSRPNTAGSRKPVEESKESVIFTPSQPFKQRAIYSELLIKPQTTLSTPSYTPLPQLPAAPTTVLQPLPPLPLSTFKGEHLPALPPLPSPSSPTPTSLQPKVVVPFIHSSSTQPPRRIAIERKKRHFASLSLSALLLPHSINYALHSPSHDHLTGLPSHLPLHLFDSLDYETYTPTQWLHLGPVHGQALRLDNTGRGDYTACLIHQHSPLTDLWDVAYTDTGLHTQLHRLHVYFSPEDPLHYTARVVHAHTERRLAEAALRSALSIDCMPIDEQSVMDAEQVNRILFLALNTKKMKLNNNDTTQLINEVHLDYSRTLNAITFTAHSTPTPPPTPPHRHTGTVRIPPHDFAGHFSSFCFHSFLTKPEAIAALTRVNVECWKVRGMALLIGQYSKSVRVEEFMSGQLSTVSVLSGYLHDKLLVNVSGAVRQSLKDVDKGWLSLKERSRDLYDYSKLRKMMTRINFSISDAVRHVVQRGVTQYAALIRSACQCTVTVRGLKDVDVQRPIDCPPLLTVDLLFKDGLVVYSTAVEVLARCPLDVFDAAFASLSRLPQIESLCLPQLFPVNNLSYLAPVQRREDTMDRTATELTQLLDQATAPLHDYLALYEPHLPFLQLSLDEHLKELQSHAPDDPLDCVQSLVQSTMERRAEVEAAIPRAVSLGLVSVNCEDVRRKLLNKCGELVTRLLDWLQAIARQRCEEVSKTVNKLEMELKRTPIDIVELTRQREELLHVPSRISAVRQRVVQEVLTAFDVLDGFHCRTQPDLIKLKWTVVGYARRLTELAAVKEAQLHHDTATFLQEMRQAQDELNTELTDVEKRITALSHMHDLTQLDKINDRCTALHTALTALQDKARHFNSNELLFPSVTPTDYTLISTLAKRFADYHLLFTTAHRWSRDLQAWRYGPFLDLHGPSLQSQCAHYTAAFLALSQVRAIMDQTSHANLVQQCQREVGEFRAVLPLVMALRGEGMQERHWRLLSEELPLNFAAMMKRDDGDDVAAVQSISLQRLLDEYQVHRSAELIVRVSEIADKEYELERALVQMEEEWRLKEFTVRAGGGGSLVVVEVDEVVALVRRHAAAVRDMQQSPYHKMFDERIHRWALRLQTIDDVISEWLTLQRAWLNTAALYAQHSAELTRALPVDTKRWHAVTRSWQLIMQQVHVTPDVTSFADSAAMLSKLREMNKSVRAVQLAIQQHKPEWRVLEEEKEEGGEGQEGKGKEEKEEVETEEEREARRRRVYRSKSLPHVAVAAAATKAVFASVPSSPPAELGIVRLVPLSAVERTAEPAAAAVDAPAVASEAVREERGEEKSKEESVVEEPVGAVEEGTAEAAKEEEAGDSGVQQS